MTHPPFEDFMKPESLAHYLRVDCPVVVLSVNDLRNKNTFVFRLIKSGARDVWGELFQQGELDLLEGALQVLRSVKTAGIEPLMSHHFCDRNPILVLVKICPSDLTDQRWLNHQLKESIFINDLSWDNAFETAILRDLIDALTISGFAEWNPRIQTGPPSQEARYAHHLRVDTRVLEMGKKNILSAEHVTALIRARAVLAFLESAQAFWDSRTHPQIPFQISPSSWTALALNATKTGREVPNCLVPISSGEGLSEKGVGDLATLRGFSHRVRGTSRP